MFGAIEATRMSSDYEKKLIDLQVQMRQNTGELQSFLSDLENWETDIKKKDETLKKAENNDETTLPPIRNWELKKKKTAKKKKPEKETETKKKPQKLHSYDYRAWDKFDVETACAEIDKEDEKANGEDDEEEEEEEEEEEVDSEEERERLKSRAVYEKDKGNHYFKLNQFDDAIECYTKAIQCDPQNAVLYANRAMALLKQNKMAAAEQDCSVALQLDPTYVKALHRRATARKGLARYAEAKEDLEQLLKLEPNNKAVITDLGEVEKMAELGAKAVVRPIKKKPKERSKKPLRRVPIIEFGGETEHYPPSDSNPAAVPGAAAAPASAVPSQPATSPPRVPADESVPDVPRTFQEFHRNWRQMKSADERQYSYMKKMEPKLLPTLFKDMLELEYLNGFLRILNVCFRRDELDVVSWLKELTQIRRFSTHAMFMSKEDKRVVSELMAYAAKFCSEEELSKLKKAYGV